MTASLPIEIVLDSRFEETCRLGPWLAAALGDVRSGSAVDDLELALVELVTNIVQHGHAGEAGHPIRLRLEQTGAVVRVEIRDRGRPISADAVARSAALLDFDPDDLDSLPMDGMGLALVRAVVDRLEHERDGEANLTIVEKQLDHPYWCSRSALA
jgi:anti-sigma regulatory factor (Ser/Thr protein kinase)